MRLIDADKIEYGDVIIGIERNGDSGYSMRHETMAFKDDIDRLPTVPAFGQWISAKDRLPENDEPVLAIIEGVRRTAVFDGEFWWSYPEGEDFRDATKWMSLPEPPKAKKDGDSREKKYYWIGNEYDGYADGNPVYYLWECSRCGYEHYGEQDTLTNYCPNCGAKMQMQPPEEENKNEID